MHATVVVTKMLRILCIKIDLLLQGLFISNIWYSNPVLLLSVNRHFHHFYLLLSRELWLLLREATVIIISGMVVMCVLMLQRIVDLNAPLGIAHMHSPFAVDALDRRGILNHS